MLAPPELDDEEAADDAADEADDDDDDDDDEPDEEEEEEDEEEDPSPAPGVLQATAGIRRSAVNRWADVRRMAQPYSRPPVLLARFVARGWLWN